MRTRIPYLVLAVGLLAGCSTSVSGNGGGGGQPEGAGSEGGDSAGTGGEGGAGSEGGMQPGTTATGGEGGGPSGCDLSSSDCMEACTAVDCCDETRELLDACVEACEASIYVEKHKINCLALRIAWINEEGCQSIVDTYDAFDPNDDCSD